MRKALLHIVFLFFCFVSLGQAPVNDNCSGAINIVGDSICTATSGTLFNATISTSITSNINKDVWYSFRATSTTAFITVDAYQGPKATSDLYPVIQFFSSCSASSMTAIATSAITNDAFRELYVSGLQINQIYYYRVYHNGKPPQTITSFNTCITTTKNNGLENDVCSNAIALNVGQTCNVVAYSNNLSTVSTPALSNSCGQTANKDVWFKAKVPSNGRLSVIVEDGGMNRGGLTLYRGSCGAFTELACDVTTIADYNHKYGPLVSIDKSNLIPNEIVYIRFWSLSATDVGTFKIGVSTPPACGSHLPAGDLCSNAPLICDLNGYCGNTSSTYSQDYPGNLTRQSALIGYDEMDNNSWISFIANSTSATFTVFVNNCVAKVNTANGIQAGVFGTNDCLTFTSHSDFWSPGTVDNGVLYAKNLTVGKKYYLLIDGAAGASCDYIVAANNGVQTIDAGPDQTYCSTGSPPLNLNATGVGTSTLNWSSRAGSTYTPTVGTTASLTLSTGPTASTRYIIDAIGACTGTKDSLLVTVSTCQCTKPAISIQPAPVSICPGSTTSFTVSSTGVTFQWKESKDGGVTFSNLTNSGIYTGVNTNTLVLNSLTSSVNGYKYKCIVKDVTGFCSDSTSTALLTITPLTAVTTNTLHVCKGSYTTITATNTPVANYTYVWTVPAGVANPGNVNTFSATIPGDYVCNIFTPANLLCNDDFELPVIPTSNWQNVHRSNYKCWSSSNPNIEVWSNGNMGVPAFSGKQFIEINSDNDGVLFQDISLSSGSKVDISFAHRGRKGVDVMKVSIGPVGGPYSQLGQYSTGNTSWGVYSTSYTATTTGNYSLRFESVSSFGGDKTFGNFIDAISVKTGICAVATSKTTLINDPLPTALISGTTSVCQNDPAPQISFTGNDGTANYKFTYTIAGGTNLIANSTGNSVSISAPTTTIGNVTYSLVSVSDANNCSQNQTGSVVITVDQPSVGGTVNLNHTVCAGSPSNLLTLSGYTGTISKWQSAVSPFTTWNDIVNTANTYTSSNLTEATKFRAVVKSGACPEAYSVPALVAVDQKSVAGTLSSYQNICTGQSSGLLTLTGNGNTIQKWQSANFPYTTWIDLANINPTYQPGTLNDTTKYRVLVKSGVCPADTSDTLTVKVFQYPKLNLQCGVTTNSTVQFTWDKIDGVSHYDFSYTIDNTGPPIVGKLKATTIDTTITVSGMGKMVNFTLKPIGILCMASESANCISTTCTTPVTNQLQDIVVCAGDDIDIPVFTSNDAPESYSWSNSNSAIGLPVKGITDTLFKTAIVTKQEIGIIKVIAFKSPCKGPIMTFKITVNPLPKITTKLDTSICKGSSIKLKGSGADTYAWDNGIFDNTLFAPTNTNTYKVTGTDVNNCENTASVTVTVNVLPVITVSNSGPICAKDSMISLSVNQVSGNSLSKWSWKSDANATFDDSLIQQTKAKKMINNEQFTLKVTDVNGCFTSASTTLKINPLPVFNLASNTPCEKQTITLFCSTASITSTYAWSHKNGYTSSQQNPTIVNSQLSDIGNYYIKFTDGNGCSKIDSIFLKINSLPDFTPTAISPCETTPFSVTANYPNANSYSWTGPVTLTNTENVLVSNSANPTTHNGDYTATVTDLKGCSDTKKVTVTVKPSPVFSISNNIPVCANESNLSLDQSGDVLTRWSWKSDKLAQFDDSLVKQPIVKKLTNGEVVTLKGNDANGCTSSAKTTITVNAIPVFNVSTNTPCIGQALTLSCDLAGAKMYEWHHLSESIVTTQNNSKQNVVIGDTGLYELVVTDVNNCRDTQSVRVKINSLPKFNPSYVTPCGQKPLTIKANYTSSTLVKKYEWLAPVTVVESFVSDETTLFTQKSDPAINNGDYVLTITDVNDCAETKKISITINPLPIVKSSNDLSICLGDEVILKGQGAVSYRWDQNVIDDTPFKPQSTAIYSVIGKDANQCENSYSLKVMVNPLPTLTVPELCESKDEVLTSNHTPAIANAWISSDISVATIHALSGTVNGLKSGKTQITFTDNLGCKVTGQLVVNAIPTITTTPLYLCEKSQLLLKANQSPAAQNPWKSTANNLTIDPNSGLIFGVKAGTDSVSFTNDKGCKTTTFFTVYGLPIADFSALNEICIDDTLHLKNKTTPVCDSYLWDFGDGTTSSLPFHKYSKDGFFDISLISKDNHGCENKIEKKNYVEIVSKPKASFVFSPDSIDVLNPEVNFSANSDGKYFKWNFGDGKPTAIGKNAVHVFPNEPGMYYTITFTASNTKSGCSTIYSQVIVAKEPLLYYIPNTFTPNGDEINNTFKPMFSSGLDSYSYSLLIYNRWGELVFESHNAEIGWDGTYNNEMVGSNTYIWKLEFTEKQNGKKHVKFGHVNIIR